MIDSAKFKTWSLFLSVLLLIYIFPIYSYAAYTGTPTPVNSPMVEPETAYISENGGVRIKCAYVYQSIGGASGNGDWVGTRVAVGNVWFADAIPTSAVFGGQAAGLSNNLDSVWSNTIPSSWSAVWDIFNVETGSLIQHIDSSITSASPFRPATSSYWPFNSSGASAASNGGYWILPSEISQRSQSAFYNVPAYYTPFVTWSIKAPDPVVVRSHLNEPVSDEFNRYFIELTESGSYLYWLSLYDIQISTRWLWTYTDPFESEMVMASNQMPVQVNNYWIPEVTFTSDGGTTLNLMLNPQLDPSKLTEKGLVYDLNFAKFNLETGEILSTVHLSDQITDVFVPLVLDEHFSPVNDVLAIKSYGVHFRNLTDQLVNLASVVWSVDPVVDDYMSNVQSILSDIRDALVGGSVVVPSLTSPAAANGYQAAEESLVDSLGAIPPVNMSGASLPDGYTVVDSNELLHGGGGRAYFDQVKFGDQVLTPLGFFKTCIDQYIVPNAEVFFLLTFMLVIGTLVLVLGRKIF